MLLSRDRIPRDRKYRDRVARHLFLNIVEVLKQEQRQNLTDFYV